MKFLRMTLPVFLLCVLAGCGGDEAPSRIQEIPPNPADMEIEGIESVELAPGLSSRTLLRGEGPVAEPGRTAVVHYTGWLYDPDAEKFRGAKFDSSVDRGELFSFPLGEGRVIRGWDQGVAGMRVGEIRELTIAPEMAYGERGAGTVIPPGATLVFVVELAELEGVDDGEAAQ
jgi:FKBP-type peptidyl-prolyl cis-trans isomerase FkpA